MTKQALASRHWTDLRAVARAVAVEQARNDFPFLRAYPSSAARKWLSAFESFEREDRLRLAPLLVLRQFEPHVIIAEDFDENDRSLLRQMLARVQHVPKAVLDQLAARPTRFISEWDESVWEASHVDPFLRRAKKADVRRAILKAVRDAGIVGACERSEFYYVSENSGEAKTRYVFDFGGFLQMRLHVGIEFSAGQKIDNITLPLCLGYVLIGYDEITSEKIPDAAHVAVEEFKILRDIVQRVVSSNANVA